MERDDTTKWLPEQLSRYLAEAVGGMAGKAPRITVEPGPGPLADALWWQQGLSGVGDATLWLGAEVETWKRIGTVALAGAGIDDASTEDSQGTYLELIQQGVSGLASALSSKLGREILPKDGKQGAPTTGGQGVNLMIDFSGTAPVGPIALMWSDGVTAALDAPPPAPPTANQPGTALAPTQNAGSAANATDKYELLLDVEMPVSVSFGRAHLPLREIVKLTSGAIVELNRAVSEPVELIVNNCVVARGEVVVVDGNYGVRIKQIISRNERLRTLH